MFTNKIYYILDAVSETILGTFYAKSDRMAQKVMDGFDFKKAHLDPSDVVVFSDPNNFPVCETFDEVIQKGWPEFNFAQKVLDFEVTDGKSAI